MDGVKFFAPGPGDLERFETFTFPKYRSVLHSMAESPDRVVAVAAEMADVPAGLVLAQMRAADRAEILSLYVRPDLRGQGLGAMLLERIES